MNCLTIHNLEEQRKSLEDTLAAEQEVIAKRIEEYEKQKEAIAEQVTALEDYKAAYADFVKEFEMQTDLEIAAAELGADWQERILTDREGLLADFKNFYLGAQDEIQAANDKVNDITDEIEANEKRIAELEKLKEAWEGTVKAHDEAQDKLAAKQLIGKNWEKKFWMDALKTSKISKRNIQNSKRTCQGRNCPKE